MGLAEAQAELKQQEAILRSQNQEVAQLDRQYTKITDSVMESTVSLNEMKDRAGELTSQIEQTSIKTGVFDSALGEASKRIDKLSSHFSKLASRVFVFSLFTSALRSLRTWMGDVISNSDEASAAIARLKGALLTMVQPIVNVVVPAFVTLCNILTRVITLASKLLFSIFSGSFLEAKESAKALSQEQEAIEGVGGAAKEASKYLSGLDEVNTFSNDQFGGGGGASGGGSATPDFGFDTGIITKKMDEIVVYVARALLALGAVLTFTGANIPLGLGLMAIGALTLAAEIKENWNTIDSGVRNAINNVLWILGAAGLVIGAILAFSGANVPLGVGLMIVGAAALATEVALNWEAVSMALQGPIGEVAAGISAALLALGAILAFSGANIALGIGLMAVGAAGLAATVAVNWDFVKGNIKEILSEIGLCVGVAFLALGAVLTFWEKF